MKKFLVLLILFPILCIGQSKNKYRAHKFVKVDKVLRGYFTELRDFYKINNVDIDYRRIRAIRARGSAMIDDKGNHLAGYYSEDKIIMVKVNHPIAVNHGVYRKIMLATIAHEIGHSQGLLHDTINRDNLMYESNSPLYDNLIVHKKPLTEILLSPYK